MLYNSNNTYFALLLQPKDYKHVVFTKKITRMQTNRLFTIYHMFLNLLSMFKYYLTFDLQSCVLSKVGMSVYQNRYVYKLSIN